MKKFISILLVLAVSVLFLQGCEDRSELDAPTAPSTGNADFSSFVSIGNSLTAGFQSNALWQDVQKYSMGNLIAQQVGATYEQPLISDPGIGGRMEVKALDFTTSPPDLELYFRDPLVMGQPLNATLQRPYNNLGIPGAILFDLMDETDFTTKSGQRANPFFSVVLRDAAFGASILKQAINLNPTFITLWIGNNDVLGYATSGGTEGTDETKTLPTDPTVFAFLYSQIATQLAATNAKVVIANIPDVKSVPFFNTVGPSVAAALAGAKQLNPNVVGLFYQKNGEFIATGVTNLDQANDVLLLFTGANYAPLIGQPTGKFYRDLVGMVPPGIDTTQPFGLHPQNPWPDAFTLDLDEQTLVANRTAAFNQTISDIVNANPNFALVNMNSFFNTLRANDMLGGTTYDGVAFTTGYLSGGLFSLDGIHPTNQGSAVVANEFIKVINTQFGASIPLINIANIPGSIDLYNNTKPYMMKGTSLKSNQMKLFRGF